MGGRVKGRRHLGQWNTANPAKVRPASASSRGIPRSFDTAAGAGRARHASAMTRAPSRAKRRYVASYLQLVPTPARGAGRDQRAPQAALE